TSKPFKKNLLKKYNGIVIENKIYENNNNKNVKNGFFNNLNDLVKIYISQNYLYLEDILKNWVDHKRLIHSRNTASLAAEYAKKNDYDSTKAFFAGLVHDICKRWPEKTNAGFLEMLGIDNSKVESYKMHQTTAALWLKNEYGIDDIEFIESIQYHTSLREVDKITLLDKIIYIADKLSVGRSFTGINKVRELALNNINEGFKEIVRITKDFIIKNNISISDEQIKIYNDIING
ncbi:MAG: bis(5'-nucleosyl)-tetraphosphatase (symmetrical) YqeK, partial [Mollicutes bacterium PWAP]|nr:bis(5'-nucleosyl)-tetraphosphatase (symmetrical) YqeK [Mollicutes bacterium PWAP]